MDEQRIVEGALGKATAAEQSIYLDEACGGDAALRQRVEDLLRARAGPAAAPAPDVLTAAFPAAAEQGDVTVARAEGSDPDATAVGLPAGAGDHGLAFLEPCATAGALGRLGHYEVRRVLGRGGFGIVLEALDGRLHRRVAIKVLGPHLAGHA